MQILFSDSVRSHRDVLSLKRFVTDTPNALEMSKTAAKVAEKAEEE